MTVRVRKARKASRLACGHHVLAGQLIATSDRGWICIDCALAAVRATQHVPADPSGAAQKETVE